MDKVRPSKGPEEKKPWQHVEFLDIYYVQAPRLCVKSPRQIKNRLALGGRSSVRKLASQQKKPQKCNIQYHKYTCVSVIL